MPHQVFVEDWCKSYEEEHGRKYKFEGGRDGKAVKALLATGETGENLLVFARAAWKYPGGYWCKHAATINGFENKFNDILAELEYGKANDKSSRTNGKSDQRARAEYNGAGLPARRAELLRQLQVAGIPGGNDP